jgi:hypothetical protein
MEPGVRGARIEPAIIAARLERAFFASQDSQYSRAAERYWPSKPCRGERNFWMQRREAEIGRRDRKCHQRPKSGTIPAKIPTETARFESAWKSAVRKNRMVVCAVRYEPVSTCDFPANRVINREFCDFGRLGDNFLAESQCVAVTSRKIP